MKFKNYYLGVFLNNIGVAKYTNGNKVKLVIEDVSKSKSFESIEFESYVKCLDWIDKQISDTDPSALKLKNVIEAIRAV